MLSNEAKRLIGPWRRVLLALRPSLPLAMRNLVATRWMRSGLSYADKAEALARAAKEMDPRVAKPSRSSKPPRPPQPNPGGSSE